MTNICKDCQQACTKIVKMMCVKCWKKGYRKANAEKIAQYMRAYRHQNKDSISATSRRYKQANPEKTKQWKFAWRKTDKGSAYYKEKSKEAYHSGKTQETLKKYRETNKEKINKKVAEWASKNLHKRASTEAIRRVRKTNASTKMYTLRDHIWLQNMFALCKTLEKRTGTKYHVDHIVPLKGKNVCGLHCVNNWAILPALENIRKGNSFKEC